MSLRPSVAVLGVGAMGQALVTGLLAAGWSVEELALCVRRPGRADELASATGVAVGLDARSSVEGKEVVVVAVKPRDVTSLLDTLRGGINGKQIVLSVAAGVPIATFEAVLEGVPVVRAMPNTPALVGEAVTAMAAGRHASSVHIDKARAVLGAVGSVQLLDENLLDAVTAVSGTGPAYVFLLAEALTEAAIREGLPRDIAESFVHQTIRGAGHLLTDTVLGAFELRSQVTSPGGTTAAAVHVLEERGFRALVEDAVRAAAQRARELGAG
ncbi:MAG TPA: pyrroline-5-carboxylate reductase [Acidimicrobiia bacterium]|nr:pyrroline-5-carboxylate reductase [Acidimicrobiia bacterium]